MQLPTRGRPAGAHTEHALGGLDEAELGKILQTVTGVRGAMLYKCKVGAAPEEAARAKEVVDGVLARAEQVFSLWVPESEVNRINKAPRAEPIELSEDMSGVLMAVQQLFGVTKGVYDPACYPLMRYYKRCVGRTGKREEAPTKLD
jgi:thiamine biosynthesis lipoprotein ApbE